MCVFTRRGARFLAVLAGVVAGLLPSVAWAIDDGEAPDPLDTGQTVFIFVVIPLVIVAVVTLLTFLPSMVRSPRYRPSREWDHDPLWFAGPADVESALAGTTDVHVRGGGASAGW